VFRQWTVSQYVKAGIDPYAVSLDILRLNFGDMKGENRLRLKDLKIYEVHPNFRMDGVEHVLPEFGPPTSTYPPSPLLMLTLTIGQLPKQLVLPVWLVINLLVLVLLVRSFAGTLSVPPLVAATLFLLWPPTHETVITSQFGFLVLYWFLASLRNPERDTGREIFLYTLMLLKPSMSLPFFILPFVRGRWIAIGAAGLIHLALTFVMGALLDTPPLTLLSEWSQIPRYMLQGAYTIQEILNKLGLENTGTGMVITLGFVACVVGWCALNRRADPWKMASLLCLVSVLWTYHERYDYIVLLLPAFLLWRKFADNKQRGPLIWIELMALLIVALALSDAVYLQDDLVFRLARWAGRLSLASLFIYYAAALRVRSHEGNLSPA
jgi:hypothetical protein